MADTMTLEELRESLDVGCLPNTDRPRWFAAIDAAIKQREQGAKDVARYRWWRRNARAIEQDEAGLDGLAFDSQVPLETIENASDEELFDLIADAAMAGESGNG